MVNQQNRRRFLQVTSAGVATAIAGCSSLTDRFNGNSPTNAESVSQEPSIDPADGVLTQVGPTQTEARQIQQEVYSEGESNGWSESRVREELNDRFKQRVQEEIDSFNDWAASTDGISVAGYVPEVGIILLDGEDTAILDALRNEDIGQLLPGSRFEEAQQAAETANSQPTESAPETDTTTDSGSQDDGNETGTDTTNETAS